MSDLCKMTVSEALEGLSKKDFSAVELTKAHVSACENARELGAFITESFDLALQQAVASDARRASGNALPLDGIPVAIKDMFCTKGVRTTAGSRMLENFVPQYESTVSANMFANGVVMLGKANQDEFAMGSTNLTSAFGPAINPWKRADGKPLVPGGSSGGSAAAVAANIAMAATGTDTGGSIRQPAAYCGITGIKPTYGRCSRWGIIAFASSLDQAGIFTRNTLDAALMLKSMAGFDPKDSTSANLAVPDFAAATKRGVKGLRIGIPKEYRVSGMDGDVLSMWEKGAELLKAQGAEIVEVSLPYTEAALATYYIIAPAECSSNLARYDGVRYGLRVAEAGDDLDDLYEKSRGAGFGEEVRRRILVGTYVLSAGYYDAYYLKAQKVRALIARDFSRAFEKCDVLLAPTAPTPAFALDESPDDPVTMYLNDVFTIPASLAGLPGMSVPAGLSASGLPLGLQVIGKPFDEETVFAASAALELAAGFPGRK
ncbi:MAG TPA: Asp-tRNA(Asn)/Glu-tRNA(Gln) amidotransferase GatCAB subunit A [Rhodospirillaceae bacterium]|nr:MAG: aspartyl/glutamyl-tRNA amidotransferase subunit A [Alphaproteobacteria bacterium GWF2_58_20]HAU29696.1 Asp-tRNA(Asn)/Glu-tRNA(Gln) amidotransferase GatCAB subunit A [Rhodospirillaceae bacterium]